MENNELIARAVDYAKQHATSAEITVQDIDFDKLDALTFSMLINDNDGAGRKGWMEYGSGIGSRKDVSLFSSLQLVE